MNNMKFNRLINYLLIIINMWETIYWYLFFHKHFGWWQNIFNVFLDIACTVR